MPLRPIRRLSLTVTLVLPFAALDAQQGTRYAAIDAYARSHEFNGTILVRHKGATVYHRSFGIADRAFSVPVTNDTKFRIASVTKLFTAALVLQLQEQGRLDLDATIGHYLPTYAGEGKDRVTLHHLLRHVSGIQNMDTVPSFQAAVEHGIEVYQRPLTSDTLLARYASGKLVREVGTAFEYNNADYIILGKVIEAVEGKSFQVVLRERILAPLGMRNSGMLRQAEVLPRLASTYFRRPDTKEPINDLPVYIDNWYAAGAMYATAADLGRFATALYEGALLSPASLARLLAPGLDHYGYGLWVDSIKIEEKARRIAYRPGSIMGANAALYRVLDRDVTVIIISNTNMTDLDEFAPWIARRILR